MEGLYCYFGCAHTQFHTRKHTQFADGYPDGTESWEEFIERAFQYARGYIDFFPLIYYPSYTYYPSGDYMSESVGMKDGFIEEWEIIKALTKKYNQPGELVTFPGYEWSGDRRLWGDHNVIYIDEENAPLDLSMDAPDLFANLRKTEAYAIPHHTAYRVGNRGKDWSFHDPRISPVAEIFSVHGSSEGIGTPYDMRMNASMSPRVSGGTIQDGLAGGNKFGIIASGDNGKGFPGRWGIGLAAVWAEELTRRSIWDALAQRRTYGITGDRIILDFRADGSPMGSEFRTAGEVIFHGSVTGSDSLDRLELIRNGRVVDTCCRRGKWELPASGEVEIKLRLEFGWGPPPGKGIVIPEKGWHGFLEMLDGEITGLERCFTRGGQQTEMEDKRAGWSLTTSVNTAPYPEKESQQALIFTLRGKPDSRVRIVSESREYTADFRELVSGASVLFHPEEARKIAAEKFGLTEYENQPQKEYANSYKTVIHRAIPSSGYRAEYTCREKPPAGENYYYLRITQDNGQAAWSSPVWITR
jgi:hypothetical protein